MIHLGRTKAKDGFSSIAWERRSKLSEVLADMFNVVKKRFRTVLHTKALATTRRKIIEYQKINLYRSTIANFEKEKRKEKEEKQK